MSTLTIELLRTISLEIQRRGISKERLEKVIIGFVEIYLLLAGNKADIPCVSCRME